MAKFIPSITVNMPVTVTLPQTFYSSKTSLPFYLNIFCTHLIPLCQGSQSGNQEQNPRPLPSPDTILTSTLQLSSLNYLLKLLMKTLHVYLSSAWVPDSNVSLVGKVCDPSILGDWGMRIASSTPLWVTEEVPEVPIQFKEPVSKHQVKRNWAQSWSICLPRVRSKVQSPAPPPHTKIFLNIQFVRG